ncbi:MAG: 2-hydroxychromene-2-carboxylate isomerase [Sneathiellaceae bacterium]
MAEPILFISEFSSPYAYIAAHRVEAVARKHGREVDWLPISLGHLWQAIGHDSQAAPPRKMAYAMKDWTRAAKLEGLPIVTKPDSFPANPKVPLRVFYHLKAGDPAKARAFALAVFDRFWGEGKPISDAADLQEIARGLGIDRQALAAAENDAAAKQAVMDAVARAESLGAFGTPTFFVDGEMYWGHDRLAALDRQLAGG